MALKEGFFGMDTGTHGLITSQPAQNGYGGYMHLVAWWLGAEYLIRRPRQFHQPLLRLKVGDRKYLKRD